MFRAVCRTVCFDDKYIYINEWKITPNLLLVTLISQKQGNNILVSIWIVKSAAFTVSISVNVKNSKCD